MRMVQRMFLWVTALVAFGLVAAPWAEAQEPPPPPTTQVEPVELNEAQLREFAVAYINVAEISREMQESLAGVQDPEQAQQIQQQAQTEMMGALEEANLDPERYQRIVATLNTDEELRERFEEVLEEVVEELERGGGGVGR